MSTTKKILCWWPSQLGAVVGASIGPIVTDEAEKKRTTLLIHTLSVSDVATIRSYKFIRSLRKAETQRSLLSLVYNIRPQMVSGERGRHVWAASRNVESINTCYRMKWFKGSVQQNIYIYFGKLHKGHEILVSQISQPKCVFVLVNKWLLTPCSSLVTLPMLVRMVRNKQRFLTIGCFLKAWIHFHLDTANPPLRDTYGIRYPKLDYKTGVIMLFV